MSWIEPLEMQQWIVNVFSGNPDIFGAVGILFIAILAGYFRMNSLSMFFMLGIFVLMFSGFIGFSFLVLVVIISGLLIGFLISQLLK